MGNLRASLFMLLVACSSNKAKPDAAPVIPDASPDAKEIDAPPPIDARVYDLSCIGNSVGPVAATVTIGGDANEVALQGTTPMFGPLKDATVDACKGNCLGANKLDTQTTSATGTFTTKALTTGGTPLDAYLKMTHTGDTTVFAYPPSPVTQNLAGVPLLTFTTAAAGMVLPLLCQQKATNGLVAIAVTDCMNARIDDKTNTMLSVKQNGTEVAGTTVVYAGDLNAMGAGLYLVCNVPAGVTTVGVTYQGMPFLAHDVTAAVGAFAETQVRPGY